MKIKESIVKVLFYFTLIVILVLTLAYSVFGQVIEPGYCYYEDISVGENETLNRTFEVCANNCTYFDLNLNLTDGESYTTSGLYYSLNVSCVKDNITQSRCMIETELDPGEKYNLVSGVCDVHINVTDDECEQDDTVVYTTVKEPFTIRYSNISERIQIDFSGNTYVTQVQNSLDVMGEMTYTCPVTIINETSAIEVTAERCRALGEVYCGDAFDLMARKFDEAETRRFEYESELNACRNQNTETLQAQQLQVCVGNEEYANLLAEKKSYQNSTDNCFYQTGLITRQLENSESWSQELTFFVLFLVGLNVYQFYRPMRLKKESKMG